MALLRPRGWRRFRDPRYKAWRLAVLARDEYTCQKCGLILSKPEGPRQLHAHHIRSYAHYPALRYEVSNGLTLCGPCHRAEHSWIRTFASGYKQSPEHIAKRIAPLVGRPRPPEVRQRISTAVRGLTLTPEQKQRQAEGLRQAWAAGTFKNKHYQRMRRWAQKWDACQHCGTTERKHVSNGLCTRCFAKARNRQLARYTPEERSARWRSALLERQAQQKPRWAKEWDVCRECGRSDIPHAAGGLCNNCYARDLRRRRAS